MLSLSVRYRVHFCIHSDHNRQLRTKSSRIRATGYPLFEETGSYADPGFRSVRAYAWWIWLWILGAVAHSAEAVSKVKELRRYLYL